MLRDILKNAIELAGMPISDWRFMMDFNRAVHDIAMLYDTAKHRQIQTIICENTETEYPLTDGCLRIERVLNLDGEYCSSYQTRGYSSILFASKGSYSIQGLFCQPTVTLMNDTVTINAVYYKAIAGYIAAKALKKTDPDRSKELMQESASDADMANRNIRKATNPNIKIRAPRFR